MTTLFIIIVISILPIVIVEVMESKKPKCPCYVSDYRCEICSHKMRESRR